MGEVRNKLAPPIHRYTSSITILGPRKGIRYGCLGQGEYFRLVCSPDATNAKLVISEGAGARLVGRRRGDICIAEEETTRVKGIDTRRDIHKVICIIGIDADGEKGKWLVACSGRFVVGNGPSAHEDSDVYARNVLLSAKDSMSAERMIFAY